MARMQQFMAVHRSKMSWKKVEENWARVADLEEAKWVRTYFNRQQGVRYCVWLSPDAKNWKLFLVSSISAGNPSWKLKKRYRICGAKNGRSILFRRPKPTPLDSNRQGPPRRGRRAA